VNSRTTPFAAILESQPPWWRLGGGGVLVVVAYLGLLLAALSLGQHTAPQRALTPRSTLVVTLFDRPLPVELPVQAKSGTDSSPTSDARNSLPRTASPATKSKPKPDTHSQAPSPAVASAAQPTAAATSIAKPQPTASAEAPAVVSSTPIGTAAAPAAGTPRGTATGAATTPGTGSARAGNDLTVLPFTDGMTRPKLLDMVEPQYTREARDANVKGLFLAKCVITTAGTLQKCRVVKGLPMMDQAVLSALARWRYTPVIYQGKPVTVEYVIQVRLAGP
jgi:protein TonB